MMGLSLAMCEYIHGNFNNKHCLYQSLITLQFSLFVFIVLLLLMCIYSIRHKIEVKLIIYTLINITSLFFLNDELLR